MGKGSHPIVSWKVLNFFSLQSPGLSDPVVYNGHPKQSKDDATAGGHHEDGRQVDQDQQGARHRFRQGGRRLEP